MGTPDPRPRYNQDNLRKLEAESPGVTKTLQKVMPVYQIRLIFEDSLSRWVGRGPLRLQMYDEKGLAEAHVRYLNALYGDLFEARVGMDSRWYWRNPGWVVAVTMRMPKRDEQAINEWLRLYKIRMDYDSETIDKFRERIERRVNRGDGATVSLGKGTLPGRALLRVLVAQMYPGHAFKDSEWNESESWAAANGTVDQEVFIRHEV